MKTRRSKISEIEKMLKDDINKIIKELYLEDGSLDEKIAEDCCFDREAINWGNLKCFYIETKHICYIEEASPDCKNFKRYLESKLREIGWDNFKIETEW